MVGSAGQRDPGQDDARNAATAAEALFATALVKGSKLFVGPFLDLDRTLDVGHGALDTLCNPRPVFHLLRTLSALLSEGFTRFDVEVTEETLDGLRVLRLAAENVFAALLLPAKEGSPWPRDLVRGGGSGELRLYELCDGTVSSVLRDDDMDVVRLHGPAFLRWN